MTGGGGLRVRAAGYLAAMTDGRPAPPAAARTGVTAAVAVLAATVTVLVLVVSVWAATAGPDDPMRGNGSPPERVSAPPPTLEETADPDGRPSDDMPPDERGSLITTILGSVVLAVAVLVALGLLWLLGNALWRARGVRLHRRHREPEPPPLDPVTAVARVMVADAAEQEDLLTSGTPRNAVVQCWHRFELQAARAGVPREQWETSAEFTLRLLELVEADAHSVARLSELYREARFSEHEVGEEARAAALETLRAIHRDLRTLLSGGRL